MQAFSFRLENTKSKFYDRFAIFLLLMVLVAIGLALYKGSLLAFWKVLVNQWWMAVLLAGLVFLYIISKRRLVIQVRESGISYPSFPLRQIQWKELNNVMLKDGLLTIDFRNNRIIQHEVKELADETAFNEFCRKQLKAGHPAG